MLSEAFGNPGQFNLGLNSSPQNDKNNGTNDVAQRFTSERHTPRLD